MQHLPCLVMDLVGTYILVCVTANFIMLHFFLFSTSGSFFALHLLVPLSPSFTSKSLTLVFFKKNAKVKLFLGGFNCKMLGKRVIFFKISIFGFL
jgi:hypothetical protein